LFGKYFPEDNEQREKFSIRLNKAVITVLAVVSVIISYNQLVYPKLSVAILAQNGVYAYFAAAFIPILFGMFLKNVPKIVPIVASVTAVVVHMIFYYGKVAVPFTRATGENPGVAGAVAITVSVLTGLLIYFIYNKRGQSGLKVKPN